jgi:hypothetical protein
MPERNPPKNDPAARKNALNTPALNTRGRPFQPGNPGRPKGSRNKTTIAAEVLLDHEAEAITRKAIELAIAGDLAAIRLCMDRCCPPRKDRPTPFDLPKLECAADASAALAVIVKAVAAGDLTPSDAAELTKLVENFARVLSVTDIEARLDRLEKMGAMK